ncbi:MAG: hypothetical protein QXS20_05545 [Candidatus Thorarchaeota archaeon]
MFTLSNLVNTVLGVLLSRGAGRLESAGDLAVFRVGRHTLTVPARMLEKRVLDLVAGQCELRVQRMRTWQILRLVDKILDDYMCPELQGIDEDIRRIRKSLARPLHSPFRSDPPGRVHIRFLIEGQKYVLVSEAPANTEVLHEKPMFAQLQRRWTLSSLLHNFSLLREDRFGWQREFEIDAISVAGDIAFLFEMKNSRSPVPARILSIHYRAAQWIEAWHRKMHRQINSFCPIVYLRKATSETSEELNYIFYDDMPEFSDTEIAEFKRYPVGPDVVSPAE